MFKVEKLGVVEDEAELAVKFRSPQILVILGVLSQSRQGAPASLEALANTQYLTALLSAILSILIHLIITNHLYGKYYYFSSPYRYGN